MKLNINMAECGLVIASTCGMIVSIAYIVAKIHGIL